MRRRALPLLATFAFALAFAAPASAQRKRAKASGMGQGTFTKVGLTEPGWEGASYTVFVPKGIAPGRAYPLVMALHGNGQKSDSAVKNIAKVSTSAVPCFVVAPQYQKGFGFNNPRYPRAGEMFRQVLETVCAEYPIDKSRLVLQGFSMGGNYLCGWTYAWFTKEPEAYPFAEVWMSSTAVAPGKGQKAPKIPYLLFTGSKETAVKKVVNVVKMTRECYRTMYALGHDVRYIEIPNMGHGVNAKCHEVMRASLAAMPTYAAAARAVKKLPDAGKAALAHASAGRFVQALETLEALRASASQLSTTAKGKVALQIKALERWLKARARSEPKRIAGSFSKTGYDAFKALAVALGAHKSLGRTYTSAVGKMDKMRAINGELKALAAFTEAAGAGDTAALQKLAAGPFRVTVYGQRAAEHLQALSDDYGS